MTSLASAALAGRLMDKAAVRGRVAALGKPRRGSGPRGEVGRQVEFSWFVKVKKLLWGSRRTVGFDESARDEKRLVFELPYIFDGAVRGVIIAVTFTIAVEDNDAV